MPDFTHVDPEHPPQELKTVLRWALFDRLTGRRKPAPPGTPAPRIETPSQRLAKPSAAQITWLGHASFLVQLDGKAILIDPVLCGYLGTFKRYQKPGLEVTELPKIDLLLISHAHRDHLDVWTVKRLDRKTPVIAPAGLLKFFRRLGFEDVSELHWWQDAQRADLHVTLVPARHWTRRGLTDLNASLWGGLVITGEAATIYHAGDSAYWPGFREIGERFPDLDVALMPIGAYAPGWFMEHAHMTPEQAGTAFCDLGAKRFVPMHWGTYQLTDECLIEPIERCRAWWESEQPNGRLDELPVGGILDLEADPAPSAGP